MLSLFIIILFVVSLVLMRVLLPFFMKWLKEKGKIGIDVHKLNKPEVTEMGGITILIVACVVALIPMIFINDFIIRMQIIIFISVVGLVGLIGLLDDLYRLGSKIKPLLTAGASLPLIIANLILIQGGQKIFSIDPNFPLVGNAFQITVLYWLLIPIAIAMAANAVNMMDVVNGAMSGPCIVVFGTLLICSLMKNPISEIGALLSAIMLGVMIIFYKYNRFPARIFSGDVGAFTIGGALAMIAIMGGLEVVTIVVAMPFVVNAFQILSSVRGFVEGRKIKERPSIVQPDGKIAATRGAKAPITLMRLTMAKGPLKENEIARHFMVLTLFCGVLAIITMILTYYIYFIPPNLP